MEEAGEDDEGEQETSTDEKLPNEGRPQRGYEQPPELDAEVEAALDRAWESIRREREERRAAY
jgi:hypothetical protein